jgi:hypothetical protein
VQAFTMTDNFGVTYHLKREETLLLLSNTPLGIVSAKLRRTAMATSSTPSYRRLSIGVFKAGLFGEHGAFAL